MNKAELKKSIFAIIKPPSKVLSHHTIKSPAEFNKLLSKAQELKCCVYYANIASKKGTKLTVVQPWQLIEESILQQETEPKPELKPEGIYCPFCDKPMSSNSGRTLHIKSQHPKEYAEWLRGKK